MYSYSFLYLDVHPEIDDKGSVKNKTETISASELSYLRMCTNMGSTVDVTYGPESSYLPFRGV